MTEDDDHNEADLPRPAPPPDTFGDRFEDEDESELSESRPREANGQFLAMPRTEGEPLPEGAPLLEGALAADGGRRGGGRPRSSPNRGTIAMRQAIATVFEDLQASHEGEGRYPHFLAWAKDNPTEFYRFAFRQLPMQIEATSRAIGLVVFRGLND